MANVVEFVIKGKDQFSGSFGKLNKSLAGITKAAKIGAAAIAATGAATFAMALKFADAQDKTAKFAAKIGVTTEELTKLHHAAGLAGIGQDTFNMATQRATRRISEAAQGTGEAVKALEELGLSAVELNNMPLEDKMAAIADSMDGLENQSDKVRLAFKLFDSEGVSMINMLGNGSEAMRAAAADAEFLGIVLDTKAAKNSEKFMDQFGRMGAAVKGVGMEFANSVIPMMTNGMEWLANKIATLREPVSQYIGDMVRMFTGLYFFIRENMTAIFLVIDKTFTDAVGSISAFGENAKHVFEFALNAAIHIIPLILQVISSTFKAAAQSMLSSISWAWGNIKAMFTEATVVPWADFLTSGLPEATAKINNELEGAMNEIGVLTTFTAEKANAELSSIGDDIGFIDLAAADAQATAFIASMNDMGDAGEAATGKIIAGAGAMTDAIGGAGGGGGGGGGTIGAVNELNSAYANLSDSLGSRTDQLREQFETEQQILLDAFEANLVNEEIYQQQILALRQDYSNQGLDVFTTFGEAMQARVAEWLKNAQTATSMYTKLLMDSIKQVTSGIASAFAQTIVYGENLMDGLKKVAQSVLANVIKTIVQFALERLILSKLTGVLVGKEAAQEGSKAVGLAGANMFASWAAAPWPISLGAPAAAAGAIAGASAALSAGAAAGAGLGAAIGAAADGMTSVPATGSYIVHAGERIIQPEQNRDLTAFLEGGGAGGGVTIDTLEIVVLPNATNAESLLNMDQGAWNEVVAGPIIEALDLLSSKGVKPEFAT